MGQLTEAIGTEQKIITAAKDAAALKVSKQEKELQALLQQARTALVAELKTISPYGFTRIVRTCYGSNGESEALPTITLMDDDKSAAVIWVELSRTSYSTIITVNAKVSGRGVVRCDLYRGGNDKAVHDTPFFTELGVKLARHMFQHNNT